MHVHVKPMTLHPVVGFSTLTINSKIHVGLYNRLLTHGQYIIVQWRCTDPRYIMVGGGLLIMLYFHTVLKVLELIS